MLWNYCELNELCIPYAKLGFGRVLKIILKRSLSAHWMQVGPYELFLSLLIWTADWIQFLSEKCLHGTKMDGSDSVQIFYIWIWTKFCVFRTHQHQVFHNIENRTNWTNNNSPSTVITTMNFQHKLTFYLIPVSQVLGRQESKDTPLSCCRCTSNLELP